MTEQELEAISARAAAATPGPWVFAPSSQGSLEHGCVLVGGRLGNGLGDDGLHVGEEEFGVYDAAFIAGARTDVPALVAALREANALSKVMIAEKEQAAYRARDYMTSMFEWKSRYESLAERSHR